MEFNESHIFSYLQGELSSQEMKQCETYLEQSPEFRKKFNEVSYIYSLSDNLQKQRSINTQTSWRKLSRHISVVIFKEKLWDITRTAAAILLPLFLTYQYVLQPTLNHKKNIEEIITIVSAPGMVTKTILPDGSEVWLNAQSTLIYPREFTRKERTVKLSGEAYFKVISDKKHRFNVETSKKMIVSAYGTEFNVDAYENQENYKVTLANGHVEVSDIELKHTKELIADEKAVLNIKTGKIDVMSADTYVETAWKDGRLVFRREKLDKIVEELSRKFGVIIRLEGSKLQEYEYTATFTDEALEDILDLLKRSAPITYNITRQEQLGNSSFTRREVIIKSTK